MLHIPWTGIHIGMDRIANLYTEQSDIPK